jgi:hypothetical protein
MLMLQDFAGEGTRASEALCAAAHVESFVTENPNLHP